jgi:hypothetical protein
MIQRSRLMLMAIVQAPSHRIIYCMATLQGSRERYGLGHGEIDNQPPLDRRSIGDRLDTTVHIGNEHDQYTLNQPPER